jgi:hypothetical protein
VLQDCSSRPVIDNGALKNVPETENRKDYTMTQHESKGGDGKGGGSKGGGGGQGGGKGSGGNWPSTTGNPSGGGRGNNPPGK